MAGIPAPTRAILGTGALLAAAGLASAAIQEKAADVVSLERLRFEAKCVFEIQEWKGKGAEEIFLQRLEAQRAAYEAKQNPSLPALVDMLAEILWNKHLEFAKQDDETRASEYAGRVLGLGKGGDRTTGIQKQADEYVVGRQFAAAEKAMQAGRTDDAKRAYRNLLKSSKGAEARTAIVGIDRGATDFDRTQASDDLEVQMDGLDRFAAALEATLGADAPEVKDLREKKAGIEGRIQRVTVSFFDTSAAVAPVKVGSPVSLDAATAGFAFVPREGGKAFPSEGDSAAFPAKGTLLLLRGTYDVRVFAQGQPKPVAVFPGRVVGDAPLALEVPNRVPAGMVYCPAAVPGGEALFVDRTEVTIDQVEAVGSPETAEVVKESRRGIDDPRGLPAWFFDEKVARAFEKASGKRIPTVAQWLHAAFGANSETQARYPWGNDEADASRAHVNPEGDALPRRVGGRERGASPYGIEDMAGNVAEWVRYGTGDALWILGGHHMMSYADLVSLSGASPLRKPMPGNEAWEKMSNEEKETWKAYRFKNSPDDMVAYGSGLRMVVPVR